MDLFTMFKYMSLHKKDSGGGGGGSFVWGTTQSFSISGTGDSSIDTVYTYTQSGDYQNANGYAVQYMAGPDEARIMNISAGMTYYMIGGTGGDIGGTKSWTNFMTDLPESVTVTVIS